MSLLSVVYFNSVPNKTSLSLPSLNTSTDQISNAYGNLPLSFEKNHGQFSGDVVFLSRGKGYDIFLRKTGATIALESSNAAIKMDFVGANQNPSISGVDELDGKVNYFLGNDSSQWRKDIPTYSKVQYSEVYPGIDLVYYGNRKKLEYDFVVSGGVNPASILLNFGDATRADVNDRGELVLVSDGKELKFNKPTLYQEINNQRQEVTGSYVLKDSTTVGFEVGAYDTSRPLVIDPVLDYSTYIGGSSQDQAFDIAVDASGNTYIVGTTQSSNFPTNNPLDSTLGGSADIFITKINPTGTALVYSTYLGGSGSSDAGHAIAVDSSQNVYVTGDTDSINFPVTAIRFQGTKSSGVDSFVTKLDSMGSSLQYSTYLGAGGDDIGNSIAVDASGNAYVTGYTTSSNFPRLNAFQTTRNGSFDSYVTKLNPFGSALVYSTYLGGSGVEIGFDIAIDTSGNAYVTGETQSSDFPTSNPIQPTLSGPNDTYVTKFDSSGLALVYSTYLGGTSGDDGRSIVLDGSGNAYVGGDTSSIDFPTVNPLQSTNAGIGDFFITKINSSGSAYDFSTYLGGSGDERGYGIAIDSVGNVYIVGMTSSSNFPMQNPIQGSSTSGGTAVVAKLDSTGSQLKYSTYLGGNNEDRANGIAIDNTNNAYIVGFTSSTDFPTVNAFQPSSGGGHDAFVAKISDNQLLTSLSPAQIWVGLKNSDAVGIKFDLKAEVYKNGVLVTSGQLDSVPGGSSGFNNANLNTVLFDSFSPVDFPVGSNLSIKVLVRNACVGSGKNSGTARLWFNDSAADSQFGATITPTASDYYLLDGFSLGTSAGPGPKKNIDVAAGAKCSPFKEFGTWQITP